MGNFAVINTETDWGDQVMSIGCCIANTDTFRLIDTKYHVLTQEYLVGSMFPGTLFADSRLQFAKAGFHAPESDTATDTKKKQRTGILEMGSWFFSLLTMSSALLQNR